MSEPQWTGKQVDNGDSTKRVTVRDENDNLIYSMDLDADTVFPGGLVEWDGDAQ